MSGDFQRWGTPALREWTQHTSGNVLHRTVAGLHSAPRPVTSAPSLGAASMQASRRIDAIVRPPRTAIRIYHDVLSAREREQERKRRSVLTALGTRTGFLTPPYKQSTLEPTVRRKRFDAPAHATLRETWRDELRDRLITTPSANRRELRPLLAQHNRERPPSRSHAVNHRGGVRTAARGKRELCQQGKTGQQPAPFKVQVAGINECTVEDPMAGYDITITDLLNMFYKLDANSTGIVVRAEFQAAMLDLGYTVDQASRIYDALDVDKDGILSMEDWTSDSVEGLSHLIAFKMIQSDLVGKNPLTAKRPSTSVTDQKLAMEMLLADLGVSAKTNFIQVKGMFDAIDKDGSGDVDGDELALTVERILRQKITKGVKQEIIKRFDKNGDGSITSTEFVQRVVANPTATLYGFLPTSVCLT